MPKTFRSPERKTVQLLQHAGDWKAGDTVIVDEALASRWLREGAAVEVTKTNAHPVATHHSLKQKDQILMPLDPTVDKLAKEIITSVGAAMDDARRQAIERAKKANAPPTPLSDPQQLRAAAEQEFGQLFARDIAQQAYNSMHPQKSRVYDGSDLGRFIQDQVNQSNAHHEGLTRREYMFQKWGSRWGTSHKAALAEGSAVTGGYGVPWEIAEPITYDIAYNSLFRRYGALSQPMEVAEFKLPAPLVTSPSSGVPNWFGGISFVWTSEAQTRTDTEPTFKELDLKLWERSGTGTASDPIIDDAPGLSSWLRKAITLAIAWDEDFAFLQGTGAGQPQGVINANATIPITRSYAGQIVYNDVATMQSKLLPSSFGNAVWVFSPSVAPQLLQLKDGTSRAVFLSIGQSDGKPATWSFLGRPAIPSDQLPALGNKGDLLLIDPRWYAIGDYERENGALEIAASLHVKFIQNQIVIRVVRRVDGRPMIDQPVTLQDGSTQVSPFVSLV